MNKIQKIEKFDKENNNKYLFIISDFFKFAEAII